MAKLRREVPPLDGSLTCIKCTTPLTASNWPTQRRRQWHNICRDCDAKSRAEQRAKEKAAQQAELQAAYARNRERAARTKAERAAERERIRNLTPEQKKQRQAQQRMEQRERAKEMEQFQAELEADRREREADPEWQAKHKADMERLHRKVMRELSKPLCFEDMLDRFTK